MTIERRRVVTGPRVSSHVGMASVHFYEHSGQVMLVSGSFSDAEQALRELRDEVQPSEYVQVCVDCNHSERADETGWDGITETAPDEIKAKREGHQ